MISPLTVHQISWKSEVSRFVVLESLKDGSINLFANVGGSVALDVWLFDVSLSDGDVRVDGLEGIESSVS